MNKRVSLKDVAEAVGVNVSTVSRALNPESEHPISPKLKTQIRQASKRLGYRPNIAAYSLKTRISKIIGVVIPDITDQVFPPILRGIEDGLQHTGFVSIVANSDNDPRRTRRIIETMNARGVDGFILATLKRANDPALVLVEGRPIVTVSRKVDDPRIPSVAHDERNGVKLLVDHLFALGHRSIANIAGPQSVSTGFGRLQSFRERCAELGLEMPEGSIAFAETFTEAEGERCAEMLLGQRRSFSAIVCANDRLAVGALSALQRRGLNCPEDVSVTGFNDMPLADRLQPPLTTVHISHHAAGARAAELMMVLLKGDAADQEPEHTVLPVELVLRGSTGRQRQKRT